MKPPRNLCRIIESRELPNGASVTSYDFEGTRFTEVTVEVVTPNGKWYPTLEFYPGGSVFDEMRLLWASKTVNEVRESIAEYAELNNVKQWTW